MSGQRKTSERARITHRLESAEGQTNEGSERNEQARGTHVLESAEGRISEDSEKRKKESKRGALTNWRVQNATDGGTTRSQKAKESWRARITHSLEREEGGTNEDSK